MIVETTIYINKIILKELSNASEKTGKSRNSIIILLLRRATEDSCQLMKSNSTVKYQEHDPIKNWHRLHIQLKEDEYEYCLDMRKFYKMSVSFIVAYAVCRYLSDLLKILSEIGEITDNYLPLNYILIREVIDSTTCWRIYWGIPNNLAKLVDFSHLNK